MIHSVGLVIIHDNKILLGHPSNSKWSGTYSIPKGQSEEGEDHIATAIRETQEELGVKIDRSQIDESTKRYIDYKDESGNIYKRVHYFVVRLNESLIIDKDKLQIEEIDWAGFLTKEEASKKIFWRFKSLLEYLK